MTLVYSFGWIVSKTTFLEEKIKLVHYRKLKILRWFMVVKNNHEKLKMKNQYAEPHEKKLGNKTILHACFCREKKKKAMVRTSMADARYLLC